MLCEDFPPPPSLSPYVKGYHLRHFIFSEGTIPPYKPYAPRPEQTLYFYPRGRERVEYPAQQILLDRPRSSIMGQYVQRTNRHPSGPEFLTIIVEFQPGVLFRLTGLPTWELTDTFVDAEYLFSADIRRVNERLCSAADYPEMIQIIEIFLIQLVKKLKTDMQPIDKLTQRLILQPENISLLEAGQSCFLSYRQFERRFKQRAGISPKLFIRIARMNKAFRLKYNQPHLDWLTIALWCGYHDYQHMAKEFEDLAGCTPTAYFQEDSSAPERLFGLRDSSLISLS